MRRRSALVVALSLITVLPVVGASSPATSVPRPKPPPFSAGRPGIGDPYFTHDGNGGYRVDHYDLQLRYTPSKHLLLGRATISARATQGLSRFDLDFHGLTVRSVAVAGRPAIWTRQADELVITPAQGIPRGTPFTTMVRYAGTPSPTTAASRPRPMERW